jgi:hypothetical protein
MFEGETALRVYEGGLSCQFLWCKLWRSTKSKSFRANSSIGVMAAAMNIRQNQSINIIWDAPRSQLPPRRVAAPAASLAPALGPQSNSRRRGKIATQHKSGAGESRSDDYSVVPFADHQTQPTDCRGDGERRVGFGFERGVASEGHVLVRVFLSSV